MFNFSEYEDVIEFKFNLDQEIDLSTLNWVQYNPRKPINRYGCSITSLNGNDSGIPDLDSLKEFNQLHQTSFDELSFTMPTAHSEPFKSFLNTFKCGRSHYLKLENGGFFPWHRDNDQKTFRIIYTISGCEQNDLVWLEDEKLLSLRDKRWYYINTKKKHCLLSFSQSVFAVFNVVSNTSNISKLFKLACIR